MRLPAMLLFLVVLAPTFATAAARTVPEDAEYFELWFRADITIAPDGSVSSHAWRNFNEMPDPMLRALEAKIANWRFQPAEVEGVPVDTGTTLIVHTVAIEHPDGTVSLDIANAIVGPSLLDGGRPELDIPDDWRSGGYGSGTQVFDVTVPPEGQPVIDFGEYTADTKRSMFKAGFRVRAQDIVDQWMVRHERVAGQPVAARFRHIVYHCMSPRWCAAESKHWNQGLPDMPGRLPTPARSVTRLLSDVVTIAAPARDPEIPTGKISIVPAG